MYSFIYYSLIVIIGISLARVLQVFKGKYIYILIRKINESFSERSDVVHSAVLFNFRSSTLCKERDIACYADFTITYSHAAGTQTITSELELISSKSFH